MRREIAITGLGALAPSGDTIGAICARRDPPPVGGFAMLEELDTARFVGERLKRKLDVFTVQGLCAAGMALEESGLLDSGLAPERIGIFVGNCLGGWHFTEPELNRLHMIGVEGMGPYVATAWFPAAVQGQISLAHGIKGYSKTFSSGEIAGLTAIGHAMRAIESGRADAVVVGATESLASAYVRAVLARDAAARGRDTAFAEGAAFLVIEDHARAAARGARVHAILTGYSERFAPCPAAAPDQARRTIREAMPDIGAALLLRCGEAEGESPEGAETSRFGGMFAVSGVIEAACAALHLGRGPLRAGDLAAGARRGDHAFDRLVVHLRGRAGGVASLGIATARGGRIASTQEEERHDR